MKILVFGAGVLGCNLARNFFQARKDVTLLARGNWAEEIKKNGLRIKNQILPYTTKSRIAIVTELKAEDEYDVIFVAVRYTQIETITEVLRANITRNIVFVGNNVRRRSRRVFAREKRFICFFEFRRSTRKGQSRFYRSQKDYDRANFKRKIKRKIYFSNIRRYEI